MSHSENKPKTSQSSVVNTTNLNVQDTEGVTLIGDSNQVTTTDFGAIQAAGELGYEALRMGNDALRTGADLAGRGLDNAFDFGRSTVSDAFTFGTRSLDSVTAFADEALATNAGVSRDALDFASEVGGGVLDFARNLVGDTVSGLQSLSMQTSQSSDDRVAKIALYAFVAVAAVLVLPKMFDS
jgi:hypothetical protein